MSDRVVDGFEGTRLQSVGILLWQTALTTKHDLGHRALLKSAKLSAVIGHLSSLFCLLPYWPWQRVHHAHHRWTGWREPDPLS
jgi:fatty acid desaturase